MKFIVTLLTFVFSVVCLSPISVAAQQITVPNPSIVVTVTDVQGLTIAGVRCVLTQNEIAVAQGQTDENGVVRFENLSAGPFDLKLEKDGFQTTQKKSINLTSGQLALSFSLGVQEVSAQVSVSNPSDEINNVSSGSSPPAGNLTRQSMERLPLANRTVDAAIPLVPGVIRSSTGEISINGATEQQSAFNVNGVNISDPASGNFRLNLPIDAVESVQVFRHPYSAEFGQFTGGLTEIRTRRGSEKWQFQINDFLPDFRFVNGRIHGIQDNSPHITFSGPLIKDRLFFAQSLAYSISKAPVRGLVFPNNETKTETQSYFSQFDLILSSTHTIGLTLGFFPERRSHIGLDFFKPIEVTPNYRQKDYNATVRDSFTFGDGSFLQSSISYKRFLPRIWGEGTADQTLTPTGDFGNYFANQERRSTRTEALVSYDLKPLTLFGQTHSLKTGVDFSDVSNQMTYVARPVNVLRVDGTLAERTTFEGPASLNVTNRTYTGFVQDRWLLRPNLSIDLGLRFEDQRIASERNVSPRAGFAWSPFKSDKTIVRGGFGYFYDKVPLNIRAFGHYPARTITRFDADGRTVVDQRRYFNILVDNLDLLPLGFRKARSSYGFVPQNETWNLQIDQIVNSRINLRANYSHSRTEQIYTVEPETDYFGRNAIVLSPSGRASYDALELTGQFTVSKDQHIFVSYVRSKARGNLNDINTYFGDFGEPLIRNNQYSNLSTDVPNRLLAWGNISLPQKVTISPIIEWRSGFPYSIVDGNRDFVGIRNSNSQRFPKFFSLDVEASKDLQISKKYAIRLSIKAFNLTNHFNPRNSEFRQNPGYRPLSNTEIRFAIQ